MLTGSFRKSAKSSLHSRKKDYVARSLAAISYALAFQHDDFHEIQTPTVHYNAEIVETELSQYSNHEASPRERNESSKNRKREEAPKMAVTNLSNLPRPTRGQAYIWGLGTGQNHTRPYSPGEDLEGNQDSPRVGKIFVDLRLAIKDLMQSKCHSFFYSVFLSNFRIGKNPFKAPVGVGTQQSVIQGGSPQRSNPFNTLWQKSGTSLLTNGTLFTYLVQNIVSL